MAFLGVLSPEPDLESSTSSHEQAQEWVATLERYEKELQKWSDVLRESEGVFDSTYLEALRQGHDALNALEGQAEAIISAYGTMNSHGESTQILGEDRHFSTIQYRIRYLLARITFHIGRFADEVMIEGTVSTRKSPVREHSPVSSVAVSPCSNEDCLGVAQDYSSNRWYC